MDLMLLKYDKAELPEVDLKIEGNPETIQLAPLILLPFVENAFKHGIDNQGKGYIKILLDLSTDMLVFSVKNSHFPDRKASDEHKGIGLDNVKRRLEHHYPGKHTLSIESSADEYAIELEIQS